MPNLPAAAFAGLLLASIPRLKELGLLSPTASSVLAATGAARTTAYKVKASVEAILPDILRPPGRPPSSSSPDLVPGPLDDLHKAVLEHVFDHPGCVSGSSLRRRYSGGFMLFVLDLCAEHSQIDLVRVAAATGVPLGTLKDWLRGERPQVISEDVEVDTGPGIVQIETVLAAWRSWDGGFINFCEHVQLHLRIPLSRAHIAHILEAEGVRIPNRRGRDPDASALRDGFETFFPGAQWEGDGTQLDVEINGQRFVCNLELDVDAHTAAIVGASVRPTEDSAAVTEAFDDGVAATGARPLALLLDNKPSNHTDEVDQALGSTIRIRATPYTPTDKPHVEGAFGLLESQAPAMVLNAETPEEIAGQIAALVVTTWARTLNHRPRADRQGRTRAEIYGDKPTEAEIAAAQAALNARLRKQELARQTKARRQDPLVRSLLADAFARLDLEDPEDHFKIAIATWPLDAILAGIAVFEGKRNTGTLPEDVDARYLRGIVKNIALESEGWAIAEALLRARLDARDRAFDHLTRRQQSLVQVAQGVDELIKQYADLALAAERRVDRTFWLLATVDLINDQDPGQHRQLLRLAARRIHATSRVPHRDRLAATRFLFAKVVPID